MEFIDRCLATISFCLGETEKPKTAIVKKKERNSTLVYTPDASMYMENHEAKLAAFSRLCYFMLAGAMIDSIEDDFLICPNGCVVMDK